MNFLLDEGMHFVFKQALFYSLIFVDVFTELFVVKGTHGHNLTAV